MSNLNLQFYNEITNKLKKKISKKKIAQWAYNFYLQNGRNINKEFEFEIMKIVAMEEGIEFELSDNEMLEIAYKCLSFKSGNS